MNWAVVTWLYTYVTIHQAVEIRFLRFIHSIICRLYLLKGFPGGSVVKNLLAMQETQVCSLDQEDPLEKGMAIHCNIFAWRIPQTKEPGGLQSMGLQRVSDTTEHTVLYSLGR